MTALVGQSISIPLLLNTLSLCLTRHLAMSDNQSAFHALDLVGFSVVRARFRKASRPARRRTRRGASWQAWTSDGRELGFEALEQRIVLSSVVWNTAVAPSGGDWDARKLG